MSGFEPNEWTIWWTKIYACQDGVTELLYINQLRVIGVDGSDLRNALN